VLEVEHIKQACRCLLPHRRWYLNEYINLYGFVADQVFLTKSGDLGAVIHVHGIDHECLDQNTLDNVTRRFEAACEPLASSIGSISIFSSVTTNRFHIDATIANSLTRRLKPVRLVDDLEGDLDNLALIKTRRNDRRHAGAAIKRCLGFTVLLSTNETLIG